MQYKIVYVMAERTLLGEEFHVLVEGEKLTGSFEQAADIVDQKAEKKPKDCVLVELHEDREGRETCVYFA